jgi:hypothetical protein
MFKIGDRVEWRNHIGTVVSIVETENYPVKVVENYYGRVQDYEYCKGDNWFSFTTDGREYYYEQPCLQKVDEPTGQQTITIPVSYLLAGKTFNGHHQNQLALNALESLSLINDLAKAVEEHLRQSEDFGGYVYTQVHTDGSWTMYAEEDGKQRMMLSSLDG